MTLSKPNKYKGHAIFLLALTVGFFSSCTERSLPSATNIAPVVLSENAVDINSASAAELASIDHIGPKLAEAIVDFRTRHGKFRRPENLMFIHGISDGRYRQIRVFIKTE